MSKLLLVRHCQSIGSHPDVPLSEAGAKAAEALANRLQELAPDAVYSSPYERAQATVRPFRCRLACRLGSMTGFASGCFRSGSLRTGWTTSAGRSPSRTTVRPAERASTMQRAIAASADIAAVGHRLPAVSSHRNLIASVLRSMDPAFGFEQWVDLRTPDLFEVELDAGPPVRFVRLEALRRVEGQ